MPNSANIRYNLDHYNPQKPGDNIFVLDNKDCACREIIVSSDLENLVIGQQYTITYSSVNNTAIFSPSTQIIRAAANSQKFSTIAHIDPAKTHIVKAEISGINILASQMCVIKCGNLQGCEVPQGSDIVLNSKNNWEYRLNDFVILKFTPTTGNSGVVLNLESIPAVSPNSDLISSSSPLITSSSDILQGGTKLGTLIYLSNFNNTTITINKNSQNYSGTITPGVSTTN